MVSNSSIQRPSIGAVRLKQIVPIVMLSVFSATLLQAEEPTKQAQAANLYQADAQSVEAFTDYWREFNKYEESLSKKNQKLFREKSKQAKKNLTEQELAATKDLANKLTEAAKIYREQAKLESSNTPYILLNLARTLNEIADIQAKLGRGEVTATKQEALDFIRILESNHLSFPDLDQAIYLKALILESLARHDQAEKTWRKLAALPGAKITSFHAAIALGDRLFERERNAEALAAYQHAIAIGASADFYDQFAEKARIHYRTAWAAFRAGDMKGVLTSAKVLFDPSSEFTLTEDYLLMRHDLVELAGDALYENNQIDDVRSFLHSKELVDNGGSVGMRIAERYHANGLYQQAVEVAELTVSKFPLSRSLPQLYQLLADTYGKHQGEAIKRIETLEKLALLLPKSSLWRQKQSENSSVASMEAAAEAAAVVVANYYYDTGSASGRQDALAKSAGYYALLRQHKPTSEHVIDWQFKEAHAHYLADNNQQALSMYEDLRSSYDLSEAQQEIAMYQLVLTKEKVWRQSLGEADMSVASDDQTTKLNKKLADMLSSIEEFAGKFARQSRTSDLLLIAAGAMRDVNNLEKATAYWQRVLASPSAPHQRAMAIRGIVYAKAKLGSAGEIVKILHDFLRHEDLKGLGSALTAELNTILSAAALDEGKRLNDSGKLKEAGSLLTSLGSEFRSLPERDKLLRDGAYMLAIAGEWRQAQLVSEQFLKQQKSSYNGDMIYLLARSHEYQLRFEDAAQAYCDLARNHQTHEKAATALSRCEKLALSVDNTALAAEAALLGSRRDPSQSTSEASHQEIIKPYRYLVQAGQFDRAEKLMQDYLKNPVSPSSEFQGRLELAKLAYLRKQPQNAVTALERLRTDIQRRQGQMPVIATNNLLGEIDLLLAQDSKSQFEKITFSNTGDVQALTKTIELKTTYFNQALEQYTRAASAPATRPEAHREISALSNQFSKELAHIIGQQNSGLSIRDRTNINRIINRLQDTTKQFSTTVAANDTSGVDNSLRAPQTADGSEAADPLLFNTDNLGPLPLQWH